MRILPYVILLMLAVLLASIAGGTLHGLGPSPIHTGV